MKKTRKVIGGILGTGVMAGGGAMALSGMGGAVAGNAATGLANMSTALPTVGTIGGMGMVMGSMNQVRKIVKRRR